jgi:YVTN family beta-propeller protein
MNDARVTVRLACVHAAFLGCAPAIGAEAFITNQTGDEISADGNSVYVVNWFSNEVWAINTGTLAVTAKMPVGDGPCLLDRVRSVEDFLKQLQSAKIARCDAPALRILGLSLAA